MVGKQIKPLIRRPRMARDFFGAMQLNIILGARAGRMEDVVDNCPHGENSGTRVDLRTINVELANFATRRRFFLDNRYRNSAHAQQYSADKAANSGTDHQR